jgi:hypothetical protein
MHMSSTPKLMVLALSMLGNLVACGASDLEPIRPPPAGDAGGADALQGVPDDAEGGASDAGAAASDSNDEMVGGGQSDARAVLCKRGVAANSAPAAALAPMAASPGISWWYNWTTQSPGGDPRVEYVPMLWGGGSLSATIPAGSKFLLGFNEPNFKSQANLTVQQAAADWPAVEAHARAVGIPIVSPSVNFCGSAADPSGCTEPTITDPYTYLKDFFAACTGCEVDYVGVHSYMCDLPSLRAYLEGNVQAGGTLQGFLQFGKPIWLTEFACDSSHSVAEQKAYMQAAVPYLEGSSSVARYAWFSAKNIPNALLTNPDGSLTDLGTTYVGLPEACR